MQLPRDERRCSVDNYYLSSRVQNGTFLLFVSVEGSEELISDYIQTRHLRSEEIRLCENAYPSLISWRISPVIMYNKNVVDILGNQVFPACKEDVMFCLVVEAGEILRILINF